MAYRSPARWLAPLALLGAVAAIMIVVSSVNTGSSEDTGSSSTSGITASTTSTAKSTTTKGTTTTGASTGRRYYIVKDGDTLSSIADKTGVPLTQIEQLNPSVDAQSLHTGQRIKLRP